MPTDTGISQAALLGCALLLLGACGGGSRSSAEQGGMGGTGAAAGSEALGPGGKAGSGAAAMSSGGTGSGPGGGAAGNAGASTTASGGAPTITLHTCPAEPDPPCPAKVHAGAALAWDPGDLAALEGVTVIEGSLTINKVYSPDEVDALSCLESVGEDLTVSLSLVDGDVSLWGLRNLKAVGSGIELRGGLGRLYPDCGFSGLELLAAPRYLNGDAIRVSAGVAGELNISRLTKLWQVLVEDTSLTKITLPSDITTEFGQLWLQNNLDLSEVAGFSNVVIELGLNPIMNNYSARIENNPQLSDCRAQELAKLLLDAGNDPATVLVSGNAPCAM